MRCFPGCQSHTEVNDTLGARRFTFVFLPQFNLMWGKNSILQSCALQHWADHPSQSLLANVYLLGVLQFTRSHACNFMEQAVRSTTLQGCTVPCTCFFPSDVNTLPIVQGTPRPSIEFACWRISFSGSHSITLENKCRDEHAWFGQVCIQGSANLSCSCDR